MLCASEEVTDKKSKQSGNPSLSPGTDRVALKKFPITSRPCRVDSPSNRSWSSRTKSFGLTPFGWRLIKFWQFWSSRRVVTSMQWSGLSNSALRKTWQFCRILWGPSMINLLRNTIGIGMPSSVMLLRALTQRASDPQSLVPTSNEIN